MNICKMYYTGSTHTFVTFPVHFNPCPAKWMNVSFKPCHALCIICRNATKFIFFQSGMHFKILAYIVGHANTPYKATLLPLSH